MTGRWTYRTSAAGVIVLAAAAFTLSYDALHQLALDSRVRPALAWLWPVVIDGTIVVALLTVLAANAPPPEPDIPGRSPGCSRPHRSPSTSPTPPTGRSPSWCSPWPRSPWSSPPTCSCSRPAGACRDLARPHRWPHSRPGRNPHIRTGRATTPHPSRPVPIEVYRSTRDPGSGRPTKLSSRPASDRLAPAWPAQPVSANATGNACSPSSPPTRLRPATTTAIAALGSPARDRRQRPQKGGRYGEAATHRRGDSRGPRNRAQ
jgi:hypothetical protein